VPSEALQGMRRARAVELGPWAVSEAQGPMLRRAAEDDAERIAQLQIASWQKTYARELPPAFLDTLDIQARTASWRREIQQGVTVLLAEDGTELTGFVACGRARDKDLGHGVWQVYTLHVRRSRLREGIGSMLFKGASGLGRDQGATELALWVAVSNSVARAFYELKGMECDGSEQERLMGAQYRLPIVRYRMKLSRLTSPA
jgi:GNAT superfamily N-acetyltransferase